MLENPDKNVVQWAEQEKHLFVSAIAKAEIEYGINIMKEGKKKEDLARKVRTFFKLNKKLCRAFNAQSAFYYAKIRAAQKQAGRDTERGNNDRDAMTAAIAVQHKLILATRNLKDFAAVENLKTVNPWAGKAGMRAHHAG